MAYNNGIDGKSLLDEISKVIDAAANQYHEAGEDAGEEYIEGVIDGIKKHSKEAKSEIAKLYEDFNKTTNNFKSRKSVTQAEWTRVLGLSKELMKSERYADRVKEKLSDISVTLKNGANVSGLEKVLEEWSKVGGLVESVSWAEAGKNYRKKPSTKKPKVIDTTATKVDPAPVVKAEGEKQEAIDSTTAAIVEQGEAIEKTVKQMPKMESIIKRYNKLMMEMGNRHLTIGTKHSQDTDGFGLREMVDTAKHLLDRNLNYDGEQPDESWSKEATKRWESETGQLKRFIATYESYVDVVKTTSGEMQKVETATETHTDALREQKKAAEEAEAAIKLINEASSGKYNSEKSLRLAYHGYQEYKRLLELIVEMEQQINGLDPSRSDVQSAQAYLNSTRKEVTKDMLYSMKHDLSIKGNSEVYDKLLADSNNESDSLKILTMWDDAKKTVASIKEQDKSTKDLTSSTETLAQAKKKDAEATKSQTQEQEKLNDAKQANVSKSSLEDEFKSQLKALHSWKELAEKVQEQVTNSSSQHLRKNVLSALEGVSDDVASVIGESFVSALQNGFKGVRVKEIIGMIHPIVNEAGKDTFMGAPITEMFDLLDGVDINNFNIDSLLEQAKLMPFMFKPLFETLQKISDARKTDADVIGQQTAELHEQEKAVESASAKTDQYIKAQEKLAEVQSKLKSSGIEHTSFQRGRVYSGREGRLTLARRIGSELSKFDLSSDEIDKLVDSTYEQFSKIKNLIVDKQEWDSTIKGTIREDLFGKQFNQSFSVDILNQLRSMQEFGEIVDQVCGGLISVSEAMERTSNLVNKTIKPQQDIAQILHEQETAAEGVSQEVKETVNVLKSQNNGRPLKIFDLDNMKGKTKMPVLRDIKDFAWDVWKYAHDPSISSAPTGQATFLKKDGTSFSISKDSVFENHVSEAAFKKKMANVVYAIFEDVEHETLNGKIPAKLVDTQSGNLSNYLTKDDALYHESRKYVAAYREEVLKLHGALNASIKGLSKLNHEEALQYEALATKPEEAHKYYEERQRIEREAYKKKREFDELKDPYDTWQSGPKDGQESLFESDSDREIKLLEARVEYHKKRKQLIEETVALAEEYRKLPLQHINADELVIQGGDTSFDQTGIKHYDKQLQDRKLQLVQTVESYEQVVEKLKEYVELKKKIAELYQAGEDTSGYNESLRVIQQQLLGGMADAKQQNSIMADLSFAHLSGFKFDDVANKIANGLYLQDATAEIKNQTKALQEQETAVESVVDTTKEVVQLADNYNSELDESNNKLMQGTKLVNEQGQIIRLFHNSDSVFDQFTSDNMSESNMLGKGHYLSFDQEAYKSYGKYQTQWYANIQKMFDANTSDGMSIDDATKIIETYCTDAVESFCKRMLSDLTGQNGSNALSAAMQIAEAYNVDISDIFKTAGYDSIRINDEINVFDPSKIYRANDSVVESNNGAQNIEEINRINAERAKQLKEFVETSKSMFSEELTLEESAIMTEILNKISLEGMSAADAVQELSNALKTLRGQQDVLETTSGDLKETFDVIQQGESVTGKFVTTAKTVHEALRKMKDALPEDKQAWGEYIDNMLSIDDDLLVDTFKSIGGSMGGHSERYDIENLGDGRVAVTFAGIREEIEATTDAVEQSEKSLQDVLELIDKMSSESGDSDAFNKRHKVLIDKANNLTSGADYDQLYSQLIENENKYQQELEETNRINKEREGQLGAYAQAASSFLSDSKYDGVSFDDKNKLFENFGNKIMQDGLSASDAMDQLYLSMEKLIQQSKEMPDDVIESFGAENEHVAETVSQLQKLSSIDLTRIFDIVDLKSFLQAFNIDQSNFAAFRKLFEELMQITNAMANGVDVGNAFNSKMDEITNTIMHLGGHMVDLDDAGYSSMMQEFYKHMSNTKVQFNDTIKADYTKDQWKSLYGTYKNRLTADLTKGIGADSLYHELSGLFPSLFPEGVLSQQDQFKLIFDKLDEARKLQANNWKTLQGFTSGDRDDIQIGVDNMFNQMSDALYADSSATELNAEADALKNVEQNASKAANAKGKFAKANKKLGEGASESADNLDDEADSLEDVNRAAANMPDVSAYDSTSVRIGADGRPYSISGTATMEAVDGSHVRTTDTYSFNEDSNRWDYDGSVQSTERTREMVQALEEYYQILNRIQRLRLNTSDAIHTEEINKLETDDLVRAYQRVLDLGIQVNDIEGQINLSVNQRQALLDVELRARQEMYDVIAKMEDKQATTAAKPYQKTVRDELKKSADIDTNVRLLGDDGVSDRLQAQITDYRRLVDELVEMRLQLARNSDLANDVDFSNRFADTAKRAQNARVAIEGVFKESQKLSKLGTLIATDSNDVSRLENLKTAMIEFASSALDGEVKINGFNKEGTEMYVTLNQGADAVQNITVALDKATGHLKAFSTGTDKATNEWEEFKTQAVQGAKNLVGMYVGFQEGVQALRTGVNYVKEIDLAMTELKKVTDETDASYKQFLEDAGSTSAIIGSTIRDFTEATATFARLGYSMEESSSMAETAIIYKNVADGLDTVEEASQSIISTMAAFGIESNNTMSIIDKFNEVGNNFSITSAGIGEALQRSASALYASGNTIDESIALITAANQVVQNPEVVGTAFKTLSLRLRGAKLELQEAGEDVEGMAESTSQLQEKLLALTGGKVNIMADANTFKNTTQILREMAAVWDDMSDIDQAAALELMGGKRQANVLASLLNDFETVEAAITTSMNSSGSAIAENEKWLDSIEGKTYQFTNALQTMWSNMLDSEVIKGFLDFGTDAIQLLDTSAGKVIAFVAALKLAAKFKGFSIKGIAQGLGDTINKITTAQQTLQTLSQTTKIGQGFDLTNVNAYAQAVANLTAKQQANLLASQGLNQEQIKYALTLNQVDGAAMREAMAHVHATTAKQQENAVTAQSIQQKAQELAMSLRTQAATADETRAKELNVVADILENATSEEAIANNLQEATTSGAVSAALAAETTNTLGLTAAKTGLLAATKALMAANPVGFWITVGSTILSLIPIISDVVGAFVKSTEEIKQEANEISQAYSDAVDEINNNLKSLGITSDSSSITTLENEFAKLTAGVDRYGNNISLTSDEYERYRDICEQIVGINPQIASGYDSATEAIGNNAGVLSQLIELQKEQARFAAQEYVNDSNLEILSKDAVNDYKEAIKDSGNDIFESKNELFGILNQGSNQSTMNHILQTLGYGADEISGIMSKYYMNDLNDYDSYLFINDFIDEIGANASKFGKYTNDINDFFAEYENVVASGEKSIEKAQDGLIDKLLIVPKSDEAYDQISSEGKNFLSDWIKNSEIFKLDDSTTEEDVKDMRDTILDMMDLIVSDAKNIEYDGEKFTAQELLDKIYDLDSSYVSFGTYKEQLKDLLEAFWNSLSDAQKEEYGFDDFEDFQISLGFDFVADEQAESDMIKGYARAKNISEEEAKAYFDSLPAVEVQRLLQVDWNTVDASNVDETIKNTINEIKDAKTILSELANTLDSIQSKYDTLQGAIDEFNERGAISGETLKSLIDNNLLQYLTFTENGLIADANAMQMLEQAAINEAYAMLNAAMVQDMENYALGKTEQMSALAQNAIGLVGSAAANAGAQAEQGAQGFLSFASAVAQAGIIDPGNLTAGLQDIYNAYQNIGNAIGRTSAYRPSDAYKSAAGIGGGGGGSSAKEIDWIEHYYTEIENRIDELNARLENKISNVQALDAKNTIIDQIVDLYDQKQQKLANAVATYDARADYLFSTFSSDIQNKINNGSLDISSIKDEDLASNIDEYYDYIESASQARVEAEELKQTIADLAKQKFDNISTAYENEIGLVDAYIDALQDQIDAIEARGEQVGASYYEGMIDSAEKRKQSLEEERNALQASLDDAVKLGQIEVNSDTWYEMVNAIYEVDSAIVEAENSMEEWQTAINDLHWENFDKLISKLDGIASELDNIYDRLTDNDEAFDENGDWTNQGIAALGVLTQKMEQAQFAAQQYAEQIDALSTDYAAGKYSEEAYNEKLAELTEAQWESIEAYEAAKDEIVDLNKARVDAVKDGMQKELDAYKELIDAKKESLEADKEAHDWAKQIAEKEQNIADIQRKLAALDSDNSTSATAQKKKLQAELLKAKAELDEAYYEKSIEDQQDALDKEYESYEENQQKEMDSLEEWLDDREAVIQDSFDLVKDNTQAIYDELLNLSQEYGVQISDEIIAPWQAGKDAIGEYKDAFTNHELNAATSEFMSQLDSVKSKWEETASAAEDAAQRQIDAVRRQQQETIAAYKEMQDTISTITIGSINNVGYDGSGSGGGGAGFGSGGLTDSPEEEVKPYSILEIFTNSLGKSYNKFLNDTAEDFDYKMSEAFIQNADQYNQEFKLRVPEEYKQFLQLVCDGLNISSTEGVGIADSLSKVFALEDIPYHYKEFLANVVEGLVLAEEQGLDASGALSAIFASEDVPQNYKDFLDCIIGNLNEHITSGEEITDSTSAEFASNAIPSEYQNYLNSIIQGLQVPVFEGTQDANNTSVDFFGSELPGIINGVFADVETATANGAAWSSKEMVRSTNSLWDRFVNWWNGVMDGIRFANNETNYGNSGGGGGSGGFVDGTANANGTAYADGNWGAPKTETSLVGEIGPEILVRNGKWTTVGQNGAEFTQVKKGDIIFNHKQSEQLLKHGRVTGRGKAYASGTWKSTSNDLDDLGEELTMCIGPNGGLQFLPKSATAMATGTIDSLTNLTQLDPTDILNRSRPSIGVHPSVVNNTTEIKIDASVGELIHVDHLDGNNLDEIGKFVDKAWEKKMQTLNNSIKKFTR